MQNKLTWALGIGFGLLALYVASGHLTLSKPVRGSGAEDGPRPETPAPREFRDYGRTSDNEITREKIVEQIQSGKTFFDLSPKEQAWTRRLYLSDLKALRSHVKRRRITYISQGREALVKQTENAISLLDDAIRDVQNPSQSPLATQPLIDEVIAALQR